MRPQDIVILLKIVAKDKVSWQNKDVAQELFISNAEVSDSLSRSSLAGLYQAQNEKKVYRQNLLEFIEHGLHYVFPVAPGGLVNGIFTGHAHPFMANLFQSELPYVWPDFKGEVRGMSIEPLYPTVVKAARQDPELYKMLALIDVIRVGRVREWKIAISELKRIFGQ